MHVTDWLLPNWAQPLLLQAAVRTVHLYTLGKRCHTWYMYLCTGDSARRPEHVGVQCPQVCCLHWS
jgi:hypothetical protein